MSHRTPSELDLIHKRLLQAVAIVSVIGGVFAGGMRTNDFLSSIEDGMENLNRSVLELARQIEQQGDQTAADRKLLEQLRENLEYLQQFHPPQPKTR